jgi:hypothetical protein
MSTHHVAVRLDPAIIARIDALLPAFSFTWHQATRAEILRALILEALGRREAARDAAPSKPAAKRLRKRGAR